MQAITRPQLVMLLTNLAMEANRPVIVTIEARTVPPLSKAGGVNPFFGDCEKWARVNGIINWSYQNAVNNQRAREWHPLDAQGQLLHFTPAPRQWGQRVPMLPFVIHEDKLYLELKVQRSLEHAYYNGQGQQLPTDQVEMFLPEREEGRRQMVRRPVILRDYSIDNILAVTVGGETYQVS